MELCRRNSDIYRLLIIKDDVLEAYFGYNIVAIQKHLIGIVSLIKEMSGKNTSVIYSTCCINEAVLYSGNNVNQCNRYSDWLQAGWWRGRGSSPGRVKNFLFSTSSRPVLGPTQPPIQWVPGALSPGGKAAGA
jgi:hypothetical protein